MISSITTKDVKPTTAYGHKTLHVHVYCFIPALFVGMSSAASSIYGLAYDDDDAL